MLLYAIDGLSPFNAAAAAWLERILNGHQRVALPWQTIGAFLRIGTHPRVTTNPLSAADAVAYVDAWLSAGPVWVPAATERTAAVLSRLVARHRLTGNLIPDAQLAALAVEHGLTVMSADTDFARFDEVRWENPVA